MQTENPIGKQNDDSQAGDFLCIVVQRIPTWEGKGHNPWYSFLLIAQFVVAAGNSLKQMPTQGF